MNHTLSPKMNPSRLLFPLATLLLIFLAGCATRSSPNAEFTVLVFSKTKVGAEKVSNNLHKNGVKAISIHSDRTQAQRQRALAGFKQGQYKVMVATDVAARGIDVEGISHVINYDIPTFPEDYLHRIGRTGRALSTGDALTFVTRSEARHVKKIEQFIGKKVEIKKYPDFDYNKVEEKQIHQSNHSETGHQSNDEPNFNRSQHLRAYC